MRRIRRLFVLSGLATALPFTVTRGEVSANEAQCEESGSGGPRYCCLNVLSYCDTVPGFYEKESRC